MEKKVCPIEHTLGKTTQKDRGSQDLVGCARPNALAVVKR